MNEMIFVKDFYFFIIFSIKIEYIISDLIFWVLITIYIIFLKKFI